MTSLSASCIKIALILTSQALALLTQAQNADTTYAGNIKTVRLNNVGDQLSMPVINVNSGDLAELHFDDMDANVKYYYYTFQLCNSDWSTANVGQFDYIKGFTQVRINNYRFSSIAYTRYTHYQATIPDRNCAPSRSGNYLLKVFLDGDTSKLAFTKRFLVLNSKSTIGAKITQPFLPDHFRTHQKVQFNVNINGLNTFSAPQQIKVVILQNYRWDNALVNIPPTFVRETTLEYNTENVVFPAGKEWRWLDVRDFRLQSDRVDSADYKKNSTEVYVRRDVERQGERYVYYRDLNGMYTIESTRGTDPLWQSDYAMVHFYFMPPGGSEYKNRDIFLFGQLTDYKLTDSTRLRFNSEKGLYETKLFLKQGYYSYSYMSADKNNPANRGDMDGNYYETENRYTILVYFRDFAARADELIGVSTIDSRTDQPGLSF